jgi:hypothetical protein
MQSILRRLCTDSAHDVPPCGGGVVLGGVVVRYGYGAARSWGGGGQARQETPPPSTAVIPANGYAYDCNVRGESESDKGTSDKKNRCPCTLINMHIICTHSCVTVSWSACWCATNNQSTDRNGLPKLERGRDS